MDAYAKNQILKERLAQLGSVLVAFSGGVDSSFLLKTAHEVLGDKAVAVTALSAVFPQRECDWAVAIAKKHGIRHITTQLDVLSVDGFAQNPPNRCYLCKKVIMSKLMEIADSLGIQYIIEGSNVDDIGDYRPGAQAIKELGILSPLKEAGLTKDEIRLLSKEMGLESWDMPSIACLASRFPYGQTITKEKLEMVDKAEQVLRDVGFLQVRVRHHGDIARIEIAEDEMTKMLEVALMTRVNAELKAIGFAYAALDLKGYRTGSMNETIL